MLVTRPDGQVRRATSKSLWSPDNGVSLLLLTEGAVFAPFVFLAAVLTDVFIAGVRHSST